MTRKELKRHCLKQIECCEMWSNIKGEEPRGKVYEEHKLILELLAEKEKGKWTPGEHECPCCGESKFKDLDADIWADWYPKYCPNCGAEMEE